MRVSLSCALVVVVLWYGVFRPMHDEIYALETRLADQTPQIQRARAAAVTIPALEGEIRELETALTAFQESGEPESDPNRLIADLQVAASDARLRITGLKPRADLMSRARADRAVELAIEGSYHGVGSFLGRIGSLARVMTAPEVRLTTRRESGADLVGSIAVVGFDLALGELARGEIPDYDSGGRRDPFKALMPQEPSAGPNAAGSRGRGLAAVPLAEVVVKGIARDGQQRLAILETLSRQSFIVRPLDRLADAVVHDVVSSGVVFLTHAGRNGPVHVHQPVRAASGARQ